MQGCCCLQETFVLPLALRACNALALSIFLKASQDQSRCWKPVGRERGKLQGLAHLVTGGHRQGEEQPRRWEPLPKPSKHGGNYFLCLSLLWWPRANHAAHLRANTVPWLSPPCELPISQGRPSKAITDAHGLVSYFIAGIWGRFHSLDQNLDPATTILAELCPEKHA